VTRTRTNANLNDEASLGLSRGPSDPARARRAEPAIVPVTGPTSGPIMPLNATVTALSPTLNQPWARASGRLLTESVELSWKDFVSNPGTRALYRSSKSLSEKTRRNPSHRGQCRKCQA
jgi:hypothetical protein